VTEPEEKVEPAALEVPAEPRPQTREEWSEHLGAPVKWYDPRLRRPFYNTKAPVGPECWCGGPSAFECGACVDHKP
jgi:hypothetical protein